MINLVNAKQCVAIITLLSVFSSFNVQANWQQFTQPPTFIPKVTKKPTIDGKLSEHEWQEAQHINDFVVFRPNVGNTPDHNIEAYISYDSDYFYVAATIYQPKASLTDRVLTQGEYMWDEDYFGLILDTNFDRADAYLFHVTPSGVKEDGLVDGTNYIAQWKTLWFAKTHIEEDKWSVEIAIPMQSISFEQGAKQWGLQLRHRVANPNTQIYWNLNNPSNFAWHTNQLAPIEGLEGLKQGLGVEVKPSLALKGNDDDSKLTPALDILYKVTPNLSAMLTLNTDFSGTEVDQVPLNMTQYSQYFTEKRDFFLQDSQIFRFGGMGDSHANGMPFYSRRIGQGRQSGILDINWGTKLTGQIGNTRLGILSVNQEQDGNQSEETQLSVARVTQQIAQQHQIGAIVTNGSPDGQAQRRLVGADYRVQGNMLDQYPFVTHAYYQETEAVSTEEITNEDNKSYGGSIELPNDTFYLRSRYQYIGKDFNPALGFVNRKDLQFYEAISHYRIRPQSGWLADNINYYQFTGFYYLWEDTQGNRQGQSLFLRPLQIDLKNNDHFFFSHNRYQRILTKPFRFTDKLTFMPQEYDYIQNELYIRSANNRPLYVTSRFLTGSFYDAEFERISLDLNYRPNKHLFLNVSRNMYYYQKDGINDQLFNTRLSVNLAFNSEWSWNTLLQHNDQTNNFSIFSRIRFEPSPDEVYIASINRGYNIEDGWHERTENTDETAIKLAYTYRW
ncbi:carbohydrate binding family 9 domain-containing protein [Pseudoalteromonas sp. SCSIO 43201]|uniref:carbohydrate binding family 9 domain-containing protein n=1 Tax=Pseudoalteromonas sp. SCSIO 43201 TaxID=2822842 RepID=UPI002075EF7B|nr:DUF5916 domain-containing protein [Pseudoalteromonas sp. SCSIO 43201]USD27212.1 carbohydrate binding family 9 domain-containing protein [Pseudoalteromonas sp. SCSIO 43201]